MLKNIRRKISNKISPEKSNSYPLVELKWATPQSENKRSLERAHVKFKKEFGRSAIDDAEAWKYDREELNKSLIGLGLDPVSTEFIQSHFYESTDIDGEKIKKDLQQQAL